MSEFVGLAPVGACVAVVRINNSIFLVVMDDKYTKVIDEGRMRAGIDPISR